MNDDDHGQPFCECFGEYGSSDPSCNGRRRPRTERDGWPCVFRDHCVAFAKMVEISVHEREELIELRADGKYADGRSVYPRTNRWDFDREIAELIYKYRIRDGRILAPNGVDELARPQQITAATIKRRTRMLKKVRQQRREEMHTVCDAFIAEFSRAAGVSFVSKSTARAGDFFVADKLKRSRYLAIYGRTHQGARRPVCQLLPQPQNGTLNIKLPLGVPEVRQVIGERIWREIESLALASAKGKRDGFAHAIDDGRLRTELRRIAPDGVLKIAGRLGREVKRRTIEGFAIRAA